jgi:hypothetical protein
MTGWASDLDHPVVVGCTTEAFGGVEEDAPGSVGRGKQGLKRSEIVKEQVLPGDAVIARLDATIAACSEPNPDFSVHEQPFREPPDQMLGYMLVGEIARR